MPAEPHPSKSSHRRGRLIYLLVVVITIAVLIAVVLGARDVLGPAGASPDERFEPAARGAAKTGRPFDLGVVGPRTWQRVYVLPDYSDRETTERDLGVHWPDGDDVFGQRDGTYVLAFVLDGKVVSSATVGTQVACLVNSDGYPRSARFTSRLLDGISSLTLRGKPRPTDC